MSKFTKVLLATVATLWFLIAVLRVSTYFDLKRQRQAYERGVLQTELFYICFQRSPTAAFKDKMWNNINIPQDCRFIESVTAAPRAPQEEPSK